MSERNQPSDVDVKNNPSCPEFPKKQQICRHCAQSIALEARICHHCGRSQNRFWAFFQQIAILASIVLVALACMQFLLAMEERVAAEQALSEAIDAKNKAQLAAEKAEKTEQNIRNLNERIRRQVLSIVTISYMTLESRVARSAHSQKVAREIEMEMNSLLTYLIPDSRERALWMGDLERRISGE